MANALDELQQKLVLNQMDPHKNFYHPSGICQKANCEGVWSRQVDTSKLYVVKSMSKQSQKKIHIGCASCTKWVVEQIWSARTDVQILEASTTAEHYYLWDWMRTQPDYNMYAWPVPPCFQQKGAFLMQTSKGIKGKGTTAPAPKGKGKVAAAAVATPPLEKATLQSPRRPGPCDKDYTSESGSDSSRKAFEALDYPRHTKATQAVVDAKTPEVIAAATAQASDAAEPIAAEEVAPAPGLEPQALLQNHKTATRLLQDHRADLVEIMAALNQILDVSASNVELTAKNTLLVHKLTELTNENATLLKKVCQKLDHQQDLTNELQQMIQQLDRQQRPSSDGFCVLESQIVLGADHETHANDGDGHESRPHPLDSSATCTDPAATEATQPSPSAPDDAVPST